MDVVELASETCDRCGAKAFVFAQLAHGAVSFCGHHGTEYWARLIEQAVVVVDMRHTIGAQTDGRQEHR